LPLYDGYYESWFKVGSEPVIKYIRLVWKEDSSTYFIQIKFSEILDEFYGNLISIYDEYYNPICELYNTDDFAIEISDPTANVIEEDYTNMFQYMCSMEIENGFYIIVNPGIQSLDGELIDQSPRSNFQPGVEIHIVPNETLYEYGFEEWK
jgi:hypothetical protein